jgi:hypothetical protein
MINRWGAGCEAVEGELLKKICECAAGDTNQRIGNSDTEVVPVSARVVEV